MSSYMQAFFIERPLIDEPAGNLVIISEDVTFRHTALHAVKATADIVQGRFGWAPFIIALDKIPSTALYESLPGTYEIAWQTGLFGMPFETFASLPSPQAMLTNVYVFDRLWELLAQGGDGDLETLLLQLHQEEGLLLGAWALPAQDEFFYLDKKTGN